MIRDLEARNGTFVNNQQLRRDVILREGDRITLGTTACIFSYGEAKTETPVVEAEGTVLILSQTRSEMPLDRFLPEREIWDEKALRADYEKLRTAHELQRDIGVELHLDRIFNRILERTFELLDCDRAAILTPDHDREMVIRAFKTRNKTDKLIISSTILKHVQDDKIGIISSDALADERFAGADSVVLQNIRSSMAVPILHEKQLLGIMMIDSAAAVKAYTEKDLLLFGNIANQTAPIHQDCGNGEANRTGGKNQGTLSAPAFSCSRGDGGLRETQSGKGRTNRTATVLFADIRGFTAMCEDIPADEVLQMLNEHFELMVEAAFRHEGTVDKFVGDQIMVVWGAPVTHPDDPLRAVRASLEMQRAVHDYNAMRKTKRQPEIRIGIGINTGDLVAGYIGSDQTMSYSVIGDEVNTASRLCSAAGAGDILISENTYNQVRDVFEVVGLAPVEVKGKSKPVSVYQVFGERDSAASTKIS